MDETLDSITLLETVTLSLATERVILCTIRYLDKAIRFYDRRESPEDRPVPAASIFVLATCTLFAVTVAIFVKLSRVIRSPRAKLMGAMVDGFRRRPLFWCAMVASAVAYFAALWT